MNRNLMAAASHGFYFGPRPLDAAGQSAALGALDAAAAEAWLTSARAADAAAFEAAKLAGPWTLEAGDLVVTPESGGAVLAGGALATAPVLYSGTATHLVLAGADGALLAQLALAAPVALTAGQGVSLAAGLKLRIV